LIEAITIEARRQATKTAIEMIQDRGMPFSMPSSLVNRCPEGVALFKRIVVGTDGSETAQLAVAHATELARAHGAALEIVGAYQPVPSERLREEKGQVPGDVAYGIGPREDVNANLDNAAAKAIQADIAVNTHAREGDPADAILDVAEETGADLIVIGNKGMTGARRFLLGSVPNKVSHHAPCGVYIVRTT
jgi:nucleotide-binding universal stress UspA family protein